MSPVVIIKRNSFLIDKIVIFLHIWHNLTFIKHDNESIRYSGFTLSSRVSVPLQCECILCLRVKVKLGSILQQNSNSTVIKQVVIAAVVIISILIRDNIIINIIIFGHIGVHSSSSEELFFN